MTEVETPALPLVAARSENLERDGTSTTVILPADTTHALLTDAAAAYHTQINDLLLTALQLTLSAWTGSSHVVIDLEGHGREELFADVDVSRTVGWFTSIFPLSLNAKATCGIGERIKAIKEQYRAVPRRGIGFGIRANATPSSPAPRRSVSTTSGRCAGRADTDVVVGPEACAPAQPREHVIDITAAVIDETLHVTFIGPGSTPGQEALTELAATYLSALEEIVAHCTRDDVRGWTPSDFPLAELSQQQVDQIAAEPPALVDIFALTAIQHGMLYHNLVDPEGGDYVEQLAFTVTTRQPGTFEAAWMATLGRHGLFRSTIVWEGLAAPVHVVGAEPGAPLEASTGAATATSSRRPRSSCGWPTIAGADSTSPPRRG